ncbi:MAG: CPBP family intramembrane metalloprotease [Streptosporangiaceae bacterium]|nr:CPBP family intramembrane metalloprotease [Streptosporangiaceae bacterium]
MDGRQARAPFRCWPAPQSDAGFAIGCGAALAAYNNIVATQPWHRRWYPLVNVGATVAVLAAAAVSGLTAADIGLGRDRLRPGLRLGCPLAAAAAAGWLLTRVVPATRPMLDDERITALHGGQISYQLLVRIPVGTVLWEETAFRGVLQAALRRVVPDAAVIAMTSAMFGIWHIRPAIEAARVNRAAGDRRATAATVVAAVAATTVGGVLLSLLRARSGSLAAPVLVHLVINCGGALAAWSTAATGRYRGP